MPAGEDPHTGRIDAADVATSRRTSAFPLSDDGGGGAADLSLPRHRRDLISHSEVAVSFRPRAAGLLNGGAARKRRHLLWTFWRRRLLKLGTDLRGRCFSRQGGRCTAAILGVGLIWFLLITCVLGPPRQRLPAAGTDGANKWSTSSPTLFQQIRGPAVGPTYAFDSWTVDEISIATPHEIVEGAGSLSRGRHGSAEGSGSSSGWEWDGNVHEVETAPLPANNATRRHADILLTIFSGATEHRFFKERAVKYTSPPKAFVFGLAHDDYGRDLSAHPLSVDGFEHAAALLVLIGPDQADADKRELLRQIYDRREGWIRVGGPNSVPPSTNTEVRDFTTKIVFVVARDTSPPEGELIGDVLYVPVPAGYRNIVLKTKAMLVLVRYFDFRWLLKADDDTFVCLGRIASMLHDLPPEVSDKVYAGVPTACDQRTNTDFWNGRVMKDAKHRWFDSKYVQHTLGGLDCYPVYMQGAFYILAQPLVEHLYRGHQHLECFTNEDVTIGSWLMGVDRHVVEMYNLRTSHLWDCLCARAQITIKTKKKQMFFHNCKGMSQLKLCGTRLLRPGMGC